MSKQKSHVLLKAEFLVDQVDITSTLTSNRLINPSIESAIEQEWVRQLKIAAQKRIHLYDSEAYRLNMFQTEAGRLDLELAPVSYKVHAAMKNLYNDARITEQHLDRTLVADSIIKTMDGKCVLGKVNKIAENAVYLIGGTCAKSRMEITCGADFFNFTRKRASEILCIAESAVSIQRLIGIVQNEVGCVNAIFDTRVALLSSEVVGAFQPNNGVSELIMIDEAKIAAYLAESEEYVTAVADLL